MITPGYAVTASERVLPRFALDFTTASLDSRVSFTRSGNTATVTNSSGVIVGVNADLPRFDYNPTTLLCKGLLIEESRANVLLNSLIDGTDLTTQSVTVTAAARTLSFYGTGQVVLSGAHSATVTGTGAYPTRTTLTFTPTAGTLTLTVTGTVQFAQLELGSFATSFIPTAGTAVTRNADVATMTGTNFSDWFSISGTMQTQAMIEGKNTSTHNCCQSLVGSGIYIDFRFYDRFTNTSRVSGTNSLLIQPSGNTLVNTSQKLAFGMTDAVTSSAAFIGSAASVDSSITAFGTATSLKLGCGQGGSDVLNGWLQKFNFYPFQLTDREIQAISK